MSGAILGGLNQVRQAQRGVTRFDPYAQAAVITARTTSAGKARADDNAAFTETWANLTSWSSSSAVQVSGGKVYGNSNGADSGINHAISLASTETLRLVAQVNYVNTGSGGVIVGVGSDTAGGAFTSGGTTTIGLYFTGNNVQSFNRGTATTLASVGGTRTWTVVIVVDDAYISCSAIRSDGSTEASFKAARSGFNVNNLTVFNSSTSLLSGSNVGTLSARKGMGTVYRPGLEDIQKTVQYTSTSGNGVRIVLPTGYDSRAGAPVAVCFHGNGSDETHWQTNANGSVVANALSAAGFIVMGAAYTAGSSTWGSQNGLDAYYAAWQYLRDRYAVGPVVFYANSMGGIESLLCLADGRIPGVTAWCATSPAADLADNYANATFTSTINSAYSISGNYSAATSGHDPMLMAGSAFRGVPMWFLAASDDASVSKSANTDAMSDKVTPYCPDLTVTTTTGGHSFDFTSYATRIANWLGKYALL